MHCSPKDSLCRTMQYQSRQTWNDLQDAEILSVPYHEDTITQSLALHLSRFHPQGNRVHVLSNNVEGKCGSDFLWLFFNRSLSCHLRVAVQAKRLYRSGRYEAFKSNQVTKIEDFAQQIRGLAIYLTYNYPCMLSSSLVARLYRQPLWQDINLDLPRDLGLLYFHAKDIRKVDDKKLKPADFERNCFPLWTLFCTSSSACPGDPLGSLILRLLHGSEHTNISHDEKVHGQSEILRAWMAGEPIQEGEFLEELYPTSTEFVSDDESEEYDPKFVLGTRLDD